MDEEEDHVLLEKLQDIQVHAVKRQKHDADTPTYAQAIGGDEKDEWMEAINCELQQLDSEGVIHLDKAIYDLPNRATILGSMFVLKKKRDAITGEVT